MQRLIQFLRYVLLLMHMFPLLALAESSVITPETNLLFSFPSSLLVIEEEAFFGTGANELFFQCEIKFIGDRAFSNMPNLEKVYVPESVTYIGIDAFEGSGNLKILGKKGSYAEDWANKYGFSFVVDYELRILIYSANNYKTLLAKKTAIKTELNIFSSRQCKPNSWRVRSLKNMRPQKRSELHAIEERFP